MTEDIDLRYHTAYASRRRYLWDFTLWLVVGLSIGATVALAEYCHWIPKRASDLFLLTPSGLSSLLGLLISRSMAVPLLFLAGVHSVSFCYTSRLISLSFCFFYGMDVWKYLLRMKDAQRHSPAAIFFLCVITLCTLCLMLRVVLVSAKGVRFKRHAYGTPVSVYLTSLFEYWGAMMLLQAGFYLIYQCFSL